jgi:hypothetical protein
MTSFPVEKPESDWQAQLSAEQVLFVCVIILGCISPSSHLVQFRVLRQKGTERAGTGEYNKHYEKGIYRCAGCDTPLFR